ncbi:hypothetical protein BBJ28_00022150 [Nothophytophthora sp. Chile5]|nr:hypothetical protein BBJ28_00022150 [Nothophytophthora sp. Chile5]
MVWGQNQRVAGGVREDAGDRLLVEAVQARLDCQLEAQQFLFVPRALQPVDPKMQWLVFPCLLLEVVKCTNLETVPLLQRAIKNEIVARSVPGNQLTPVDSLLATMKLGERSHGLGYSLEVATPLLGSRPSNRRFSLVDYDTVQTAAGGLASPQVTPEVFGIWKQGVALNETARQSTSLQRRQYCPLHDHAPPPPVLTIVRLVCRDRLPISSGNLPHVARLLDAFLDELSDTLTLARGYLLSDGSLRLLQYLAAHERPTTDPILRRWAFNDVVGCAAAKGDLETLQWLLESYLPDEFLTKAVAEAASGGHLNVLEWLWANHRSRGYWGSTEMGGAIRNKHSAVVTWLRDHTMPRPECAANLVDIAVRCGDLTTLQWLIERFDVDTNRALSVAAILHQWDVARWIVENCQMMAHPMAESSRHFRRAAGDGNLQFLKLVTSRKLWTPNGGTAFEMISSAAAAGHLEVVKWLHEDLGINSAGNGYVKAAMGGHLEVLKFLHNNHLRNGSKRFLLDEAARSGFLDVVQWLHAYSYETSTTRAMDGAAQGGHLNVVQWLHEHRSEGCRSAAMHFAAANGHMDVVKWLHSHRSEGCQETTLSLAAKCGNLDMVQWLHDNRHEGFSCPDAMDIAAGLGYLDVVKWLHENRGEGCTVRAMDEAAEFGHLEIVKWLHENRSEGCSVEAMDGAAKHGNLEMVKWLHDNRTEGCTKNAISSAAFGGHLNMVKWLCRNRSEGCTPDAIEGALREGWLDIVVFLHSERLECRNLEMNRPLWISRIEVAEWVLEHFPREFKDCGVEVEPGDWYFGDWLRRTNQMRAD